MLVAKERKIRTPSVLPAHDFSTAASFLPLTTKPPDKPSPNFEQMVTGVQRASVQNRTEQQNDINQKTAVEKT